MTQARVAVAPDRHALGFDGSDREVADAYRVMDLVEALTTTWQTDAHLVTYLVAGAARQPRINKAGLPYFGRCVEVNVFFCDVDNPEHGSWTRELLDEALRQHDQLEVLRTAGLYLTQHGRRIVQPIAAPIPVERVEQYVRRWLMFLEAAGVAVDWACRDWTRHFRLPHVRRGGRPWRSPLVRLDGMRPIDLAPIAEPSLAPSPTGRQRARPVPTLEWADQVPPVWRDRVERIAASVRGVRSEWHTLFLALAGALLSRGVPAEQIPVLCRAISLATGADTRTGDREAAARTTVARRLAGHRLTGYGELSRRWPTVAEALAAALAVGSEAHLRATAAAPPSSAILPLADATAALETAIRQAPDGLTLVRAECGLGKTAAAIRVACARAARPYASPAAEGLRAPVQSKTSISVDKNGLAAQVAADIARSGTKVRRIFGPLSVLRDDGRPECRYFDVAQALVEGHQAMQWELCEGRGRERCEHYDDCIAREGADGPADARVTVGPHALIGRLDGDAGSTGLLIIDEPPEVLETVAVTLDDLDNARSMLRAFDGAYAGAMAPALAAVHAWVAELGPPDEPTDLKDAVRRCQHVVANEDLEQARRSAGLDAGDAVDCARAAPFPKGRSGTAPPIHAAYLAMARNDAEVWARPIGRASKVLYAIHRSLASDERVAARIEGGAERVLVVTGAREKFVAALKRAGAVVVTDANVDIQAPIYAKLVGYEPPLHRFAAVDGAPIERTLLRCRAATRKNWLPRRQLVIAPSLVTATRSIFDWAIEQPGATRLAIITMKLVELAIRGAREPTNADVDRKWAAEKQPPATLAEAREKLGPIVAAWTGQLELGHYGGVRGLNSMADVDCLATLGDPWPNLGAVKNDVGFLELADAWEERAEAMCRAELEQAHGRIRAVHRTRPARALHVGNVVPGGSGWSSGNVRIRRFACGRPARTAAMEPAELQAIVASMGGLRATARAVGCDFRTLHTYCSGRTPVPDHVARSLRGSLGAPAALLSGAHGSGAGCLHNP